MRFALLGEHPDGLDMARALVATGCHEIATYTGQPGGAESLRRWGLTVKPIRDVEEVLADPTIEAVIVASGLADRPTHLRRALQSERHVVCVHPADQTPDIAYEAALIQGDTQRVLLPLLPEALHPAFTRLAEFVQAEDGPLGIFRLLQTERSLADEGLMDTVADQRSAPVPGARRVISAGARDGRAPGQKLSLPGWDVLRSLGGEVAEVFALNASPPAGEEPASDEPVLLTGRFERRGLFQESFLPGQNETRWHLVAIGSYGRAELVFPKGWPGPCYLVWQDEGGDIRKEEWPTWNPWPAMVEVFETAAAQPERTASQRQQGHRAQLTWQTAVRSLELDDAARRSLHHRRVSTLEYPEATEEVGFKGTMTLVGCGMLWVSLLLLVLSAWVSWLKWAIVPLLIVFLTLQLLRWLVPGAREQKAHNMRATR